jgi:hypothetical protein
MKAKIDKKLCEYCDISDKENQNICLNKMMGGNCRFDK